MADKKFADNLNFLHRRTGKTLNTCKKALEEAEGDPNVALLLLAIFYNS